MEQNKDQSLNIDEMLENARPVLPAKEEEPETPAPIADELGEQMPVILPTTYPEQTQENEEEMQTGLVITKEQLMAEEARREKENAKPSHMPDFMNTLDSYMEEQEESFIEQQKLIAEVDPAMKAEQERLRREAEKAAEEAKLAEESDEDEDLDEEERSVKFKRDYDESVVIINKLNSGSVEFTEEERAKLSRSKKIRVEEVELVSLQTLRTRKPKKNSSVEKIIHRRSSTTATPVVLTASGYTASLMGASTHELVTLMNSSENAMVDAQSRWSIIHSKLTETSIPGLVNDFNKFLKATAFTDYNMFLYGILLATYPDKDKVPLTCDNEECGKEYDHEYSPRELLRVEKLSSTPTLRKLVSDVVDNSIIEEKAIQVHESAPVNTVKAIRLPVSGHILEIYVQSAHDFIYKTISALANNEEEKYGQAAMLATIVNRALVLDPDSDPMDPEYIEYVDPLDITKLIFSFRDMDILTLSNQGEILADIAFDFGLMDVTCPHCGKHHDVIPLEIEQMLFYQYQQAMSTTVE